MQAARSLVMICLLWCGTTALADQEDARFLRQSGNIVSLTTLLSDAYRRKPGELLEVEVELEHDESEYLYEVEILDREGIVWELRYDAVSGEFIGIEKDS